MSVGRPSSDCCRSLGRSSCLQSCQISWFPDGDSWKNLTRLFTLPLFPDPKKGPLLTGHFNNLLFSATLPAWVYVYHQSLHKRGQWITSLYTFMYCIACESSRQVTKTGVTIISLLLCNLKPFVKHVWEILPKCKCENCVFSQMDVTPTLFQGFTFLSPWERHPDLLFWVPRTYKEQASFWHIFSKTTNNYILPLQGGKTLYFDHSNWFVVKFSYGAKHLYFTWGDKRVGLIVNLLLCKVHNSLVEFRYVWYLPGIGKNWV